MPETDLQRAYRAIRWRLRLRRVLEAAAIAACIAALAALAGTQPMATVAVAAVTCALAFLGLGLLPAYAGLSPTLFAEHLDRRFPELEESAELMLGDAEQLAPMRRLQRARVEAVLPSSLAERSRWLPPAMRGATPWVLAAATLLTVFAAPIRSAVLSSTAAMSKSGPASGAQEVDSMISATDVRIEPPAYTGLDAQSSDNLDLELPEGSLVTWRLQFRSPGEYALRIGDEPPLRLAPGPDDTYSAEARIDRTSLYRIVADVNGSEQALAGVYTLSVSLDRPPRVRIVEPDETAIDIAPGESTRFDSRVEVHDDFGVGPVEIRASVAKGSGEGVKFRDEVLDFDAGTPGEDGNDASRSYGRAWDLAALGMEPGDEVYFFVVASDNREPEPNVSRSETVVVRWLDEAPEPVIGGDLAIDVMPEYFKSQRQIIIETEELIADRDMLDTDTFAATSRALGESQAALKNRYGQYLGDEFGESLDGDIDLPELAETPESGEGNDDHDEAAHDGHDHDDDAGGDAAGASRPGSAEALLARYMHTHEAADIGPVSARNPVGLMKRAIAKMWQAELHLRLAEPDESLPHQYEALEYYNRAREADRIFTQRLGFEPPPVTEERRLTGDIDDVSSQRLEQSAMGEPSDERLFRELYLRLSTRSPSDAFDPDELALLERAADRLQQLSADRPALIRQAATLEQLRLSGRPADNDCEDCVADAMRAAWSVLSSPHSEPVQGTRPLAADDALVRDYAGLEPSGE